MIWGTLLLALILRLVNINQSLWLDEASQVLMSQKSLYSIIFERSGDFHPPLSYLIYHFWLMFGSSEIWLRLIPVIFGLATVFIIYKLCQKLFNEKIALISAILLATAPYHIYYSQEIRMYSMATFFASLSMFFLINQKKWGYVLATVTLLLTHYMGVFLVIAQLLYKKNLKLLGFVLLLYLPWVPFFLSQLQAGVKADQYLPGWGSLLSLEPVKAIPITFLKFSIGRIDFENTYVYGMIAIIVLGVYGFLMLKVYKESKSRLFWFWLLIPVLLSWVISFFIPMNQPSRLLFVLPAFYILLAIGIEQLKKYWKLGLGVVLTISLMGLAFYYIDPKFQRENWRDVTKDIPENAVFAWPISFDPYIWYGGKGVGVVKNFPATEDDITQNMEKLGDPNEVYMFEYLQALSDPNKNIQFWLNESGYKLEKTLNYNGVGLIYKYTK